MRRKKDENTEIIESNAVVIEQNITETLEKNYMPYAMSVIISRAIPEIDGFKPSHRKLLFSMYRTGLLTSSERRKSSAVVGDAMKLNPHGDASIYETLVRLTRGNEALLHPFVDSKGSFGKQYSKNMAYAAARYTEVKLDKFCEELFKGIDKDAVEFVPNYDNTIDEPVLLPVTFPNILVSPNTGIAVGIASKICSFNLGEICDAAAAIIENENADLFKYIKGPDFSTGGKYIFDKEQLEQVFETGRGKLTLKGSYRYLPKENIIEITEIPYTTTVEDILDKIGELCKDGKLKDVNDARDETDLTGLKIAVDLKRGADPEKIMSKLYSATTLKDDFSCNFTVLIGNRPMLLGVRQIIIEWQAFRTECVKRQLYYILGEKKDRLHLLKGLQKLLLDIDKAIKIIRSTENDKDVIPNLCAGFDIDKIQAEYIAEIKLRNLNKQYILDRVAEINKLLADIEDIEAKLKDRKKIDALIIKELRDIKAKYGMPRKTEVIYEDEEEIVEEEVEIENYLARIILSNEGYFKKILPKTLKPTDEQMLKDGDAILSQFDAENTDELIFFTDKGFAYKSRVYEFECKKAGMMGEYLPTRFGMEQDERIIAVFSAGDYSSMVAVFFENGKGLKYSISTFKTKNNRKKLNNAFSTASKVVGIYKVTEDAETLLITDSGKAAMISTKLLPVKSTRDSMGNAVLNLKRNDRVVKTSFQVAVSDDNKKYRKIKIPATPVAYTEVDMDIRQESLL